MSRVPPLLFDTSDVHAIAHEIFRRVWRTTLAEPGFLLLRVRKELDSIGLRRTMCELVQALPQPFEMERIGRFDQQVSSKFHRDGAPLASLLFLGYEPTSVRSRFWIADVSAAAKAEQKNHNEYLAAFNPMFPAGEAKLRPFVTEVPLPQGEPFILAINNSQLPMIEGVNPLGVLHRAVIEEPDPLAHRVINSLGLTPASEGLPSMKGALERFLTRDDLD